MAYLQLETMREVTESEIRYLFPNTSFTTPFVAPEGFVWVFPAPSPTVTELQVAVRDGVEQDSKGNWVEKWLTKDMFSDIVEDGVVVKTKLQQETEHLAKLAKEKADNIVKQITDVTSARLNTFAQTRNYDSILSACTYATSQIPQFAKEGQYCVDMRDATWTKLYQIMQEVEAGTRPMPTGYADIESELPVLEWPV